MRGVKIDDEMLVGRVGEQADAALAHRGLGKSGEHARQSPPQRFDLVVAHVAPHQVRVGYDLAAVHHGRLGPTRQPRKTVAEDAAVELVDIDGARGRIVACVARGRIEPEEQLSLHRERERESGEQAARARAGAHHQPVGDIGLARRMHAHAIAIDRPAHHRLEVVQLRAMRARHFQVRGIALLRREPAGVRIEYGDVGLAWLEGGKARPHVARREHLMLKAMLAGAAQCAGDERAVLRPEHEPAGHVQQRCPAPLLELAPQGERALHHGDVHWVLEVHLANDPAVAVRRPEPVPRRPPLQSEHALSPQREVRGGRAPHGAESGDDGVEVTHGGTGLVRRDC